MADTQAVQRWVCPSRVCPVVFFATGGGSCPVCDTLGAAPESAESSSDAYLCRNPDCGVLTFIFGQSNGHRCPDCGVIGSFDTSKHVDPGKTLGDIAVGVGDSAAALVLAALGNPQVLAAVAAATDEETWYIRLQALVPHDRFPDVLAEAYSRAGDIAHWIVSTDKRLPSTDTYPTSITPLAAAFRSLVYDISSGYLG